MLFGRSPVPSIRRQPSHNFSAPEMAFTRKRTAMTINRTRFRLGLLVACGLWVLDCHEAQATAIALSQLTASNLVVAPAVGSVSFDNFFSTDAFAQAQNSLGELNQDSDSEINLPSEAAAVVTWAKGHAISGDGFLPPWSADSSVNLPGADPKAASSVGNGDFFIDFTITGGTGSVAVNFSVVLDGLLQRGQSHRAVVASQRSE